MTHDPELAALAARLQTALQDYRAMTPYQQRTLARAQARIRADIEQGIVPPTVRGFEQLHDFVDANEYLLDDAGDFDAELEGLSVEEITREVMGPVIDALSAWLREGRKHNGRQMALGFDAPPHAAAPAPLLIREASVMAWPPSPQILTRAVTALEPFSARRPALNAVVSAWRSSAPLPVETVRQALAELNATVPSTAKNADAHAVAGAFLRESLREVRARQTSHGEDPDPEQMVLDREGARTGSARAARAPAPTATPKRGQLRNTVYMDVMGFDGRRLRVLTEAHDGTQAGIVSAASRLQHRAHGEVGHHTQAGSRLYATDARGALAWVISPNLAHVSPYDSPEARETLGLPKRNDAGVVFSRDAVEELNRVRPMRRGSALQELYLLLAQSSNARVPRELVLRALKNLSARSSPNAARAASMVRRTLGVEAAQALPPQGAASAAVKLMHFSQGRPAIGAVIAAWRANAPVALETAQQALAELDATTPRTWLAEDHWLAAAALRDSIRAAHAPHARKRNGGPSAKTLDLIVSGRGAKRTITSQVWDDAGELIGSNSGRLDHLWPGYDLGRSHHDAAAQSAVYDHDLNAGDSITLYVAPKGGSPRVVRSWVINAERTPVDSRG